MRLHYGRKEEVRTEERSMGYILNENIVKIDMGDKLLLSFGQEEVIQLSDVSKSVFEAALRERDIDGVVNAICTEYEIDVDVSQVKSDVTDCIDMLMAKGVLQVV